MDKPDLLALYDREMRIELRLPGMTYEPSGRILRDISPGGDAGFIDYADLDESCAEAEIDAQVAWFDSRGMPFTWKVFDHDRPPDLRQRLAARGFRLDAPNALMILDTRAAPPVSALDKAAALPGIVQRVADAAGVEAIVRLEEEVWQAPRDWLRQRLLHQLQTQPERLSLFAVLVDGRTVSAAWLYTYPPAQFASLLGGATLSAYRGRGYYTALLAARITEARQRGIRFLAVDASPHSRPILEQHGFACLGFSSLCRWTGPVNDNSS